MHTQSKAVWLGVAGIGFMWGLSFLFTNLALEGLAPLQVALSRVAIATAVLVILATIVGGAAGWMSLRGVPALLLVALGLLNAAIPFGLITFAQEFVPSSTAAVYNATVPILTVVLAVAARREGMPGPWKVTGVAIGFVGILVIAGSVGSLPDLPGLALLGAAASYAGAFVLAAHPAVRSASGPAVAAVQMFVGTLGLFGVWLVAGREWATGPVQTSTVASVLALAVISTAVPAALYFWLVRNAGPSKASLVTYVVPVVGVLAGWVVLQEVPTVQIAVGVFIVFVGLTFTRKQDADWRRKDQT